MANIALKFALKLKKAMQLYDAILQRFGSAS